MYVRERIVFVSFIQQLEYNKNKESPWKRVRNYKL